MYTETQLSAIKIFGRKDLTEGCKVICNDGVQRTIVDDCEFTIQTNGSIEWNYQGMANESEDIGIKEILGHEPHLFPDVARVAEEQGKRIDIHYFTEGFHISFQPLNKTLNNPKYIVYNKNIPLLSQPYLSEIVNLFSTP